MQFKDKRTARFFEVYSCCIIHRLIKAVCCKFRLPLIADENPIKSTDTLMVIKIKNKKS